MIPIVYGEKIFTGIHEGFFPDLKFKQKTFDSSTPFLDPSPNVEYTT